MARILPKVGQAVTWLRSAHSGHVYSLTAEVLRIGARKVRVVAIDEEDKEIERWVDPDNLIWEGKYT